MRYGDVFSRLTLALTLLGVVPLYAQWIKTGSPDSVRVLFTEYNDPGEITHTAIFAGTNQGVYRSLDSGATWTSGGPGAPSQPVTAICALDGSLYVGTQGEGVYRSSDTGSSWISINQGLQNLHIHALACRAGALYAGTNEGIFRTVNGGGSWEAANTGLGSTAVRALAGTLFAGTEGGGVFRTVDGVVWQATNTGLTSLYVHAILDEGVPTVATDSGIFRMFGGNDWIWAAANTGLTTHNVRRFAYVPLLFGTVVAATDKGVFRADNFAATEISWSAFNDGLTDLNVRALAFSAFGSLFAGTNSGIWRYDGIYASSVRFQAGSRMDLRISSSGSAFFTIDSPSRVSLTVHALTGQKVAVLLDERLRAGSYVRRVNTSGLAPGLHVMRLQTEVGTDSRIFIKRSGSARVSSP